MVRQAHHERLSEESYHLIVDAVEPISFNKLCLFISFPDSFEYGVLIHTDDAPSVLEHLISTLTLPLLAFLLSGLILFQ